MTALSRWTRLRSATLPIRHRRTVVRMRQHRCSAAPRGDLLSRSDEHLVTARDGLPLRGKGDSPVRSVCSFLASTRAATVSSSAQQQV